MLKSSLHKSHPLAYPSRQLTTERQNVRQFGQQWNTLRYASVAPATHQGIPSEITYCNCNTYIHRQIRCNLHDKTHILMYVPLTICINVRTPCAPLHKRLTSKEYEKTASNHLLMEVSGVQCFHRAWRIEMSLLQKQSIYL